MALQNVGNFLMLPWEMPAWTGSAITLDAAADRAGCVFKVSKTGNISKLTIRVAGVTTSQALDIGLYTVDSNGDPTATAYGGMTVGTLASVSANTTYEITLGTAASATRGDTVAAVLKYSGTAGTINVASYFNSQVSQGFPYAANNLTGSYTHQNNAKPLLTVGYDDGTYEAMGVIPANATGNPTFNSGSTPDEIGNRITLPFSCRAAGAWMYADIDNVASVVLYDTDGTTALETVAIVPNERSGTTTCYYFIPFSSSRTLTINSTYRIVLKPTSTSNVGYSRMTVLSAAQMGMLPLGTNCYETSRTDAGSWTDDNTSRISIGLLIDQLSDNAGAGGLLTHPGMTGGMRG